MADVTASPTVAPGVYRLGRAASPQFTAAPIVVRVIRRQDRSTYPGWAWVEAYQLNAAGDAVARRELYVMPDGMEPVPDPARVTRRRVPARREPVRHTPVRAGA